MPEFDKNAAYIWACYLVGALTIGAAVLHAWLSARAARRTLDTLAANDEDTGP
ncbi:heme exporter protein CcmD [Hyphomonas sp.]|uniref:heme exporter protein CcmD n=1 Tax=Hyphomonas sp. TaxID=87 RepID=UPI00391DC323